MDTRISPRPRIPLWWLMAGMLCISLCTCKKKITAPKPATLPAYIPFAGTSPFYDSIPPNPEVDPNSAAMVQSLVEQASQGFVVSVQGWTVPVYFAGPNTPRYDVKLTAGWAPKKKLLQVPIPDYAEPDRIRKMTVIWLSWTPWPDVCTISGG